MDFSILVFIVLGLIGGVAHVIIDSEKWDDLKEFSAFKMSVIGGICGCIYFFLYSNNDFPNGVMTFVAGYFGTDFIKSVVEKARKK